MAELLQGTGVGVANAPPHPEDFPSTACKTWAVEDVLNHKTSVLDVK